MKNNRHKLAKKKNQYQMNHFLFPVWFIELFTSDLLGARGLELGEALTITAYRQYPVTLCFWQDCTASIMIYNFILLISTYTLAFTQSFAGPRGGHW